MFFRCYETNMNTRETSGIDEITLIWSKYLDANIFYLPVLGPVNISNRSALPLLKDVLLNSKKREFLSYDKNKRWFDEKVEKILPQNIFIEDKYIFIPVKDKIGSVLKVFYYSNISLNDEIIDQAGNCYSDIIELHKLNGINLFCIEKPSSKKQFIVHNVYLKNINSKDKMGKLPETIRSYDQLPPKTQSTLKNLGKEEGLNNFVFLSNSITAKKIKSDTIICAVIKNRIVGAIGPLDIHHDAFGVSQLFPPNFGVVKIMRRLGIGEALWRSAISLAHEKGAEYALVQNIPNSSASRFYEKQGLVQLGSIYSYFTTAKKAW